MLARLGRASGRPLLPVGGACAVGAAALAWSSGGAARADDAPDASMRSALHHLDPHLAARGRANEPGVVGKRHAPGKTHVVRIALTGGPCAGKSSALEHLARAGTEQGFDVVAAPETATIMLNSGLKFDFSTTAKVLAFQTGIISMQLQMERSFTAVAASSERPTIIVFDRGLLDAKGYMSAAMWEAVLDMCNISEDYCLGRYDGVVHLVTAANGAGKYYKYGEVTDDSGCKVFRKETPEEAVALDDRMQETWRSHPRHIVVPNNGSFREKLETTTAIVLAIAHEKHPQDAKARKWWWPSK